MKKSVRIRPTASKTNFGANNPHTYKHNVNNIPVRLKYIKENSWTVVERKKDKFDKNKCSSRRIQRDINTVARLSSRDWAWTWAWTRARRTNYIYLPYKKSLLENLQKHSAKLEIKLSLKHSTWFIKFTKKKNEFYDL